MDIHLDRDIEFSIRQHLYISEKKLLERLNVFYHVRSFILVREQVNQIPKFYLISYFN